MDTSNLKEIGMNEAQIKIYTTLINYGSLSAKEISDKAGLYRPYVYDNLEKLKEKGLVTHFQDKKKKYYQAVDPERIIDIIEHKKELLQETVGELKKRFHHKKADYNIQIFEANDGLKIFYEELYNSIKKESNSCLFVIGGSGEASKHVEPFFSKLLKRGFKDCIHEKIDIRMIYNSTARESEIVKRGMDYIGIKFTPKEYDCDATIILTDDLAATMILKDRPFVMCNSNEHIISSYKKIFNRLWESY